MNTKDAITQALASAIAAVHEGDFGAFETAVTEVLATKGKQAVDQRRAEVVAETIESFTASDEDIAEAQKIQAVMKPADVEKMRQKEDDDKRKAEVDELMKAHPSYGQKSDAEVLKQRAADNAVAAKKIAADKAAKKKMTEAFSPNDQVVAGGRIGWVKSHEGETVVTGHHDGAGGEDEETHHQSEVKPYTYVPLGVNDGGEDWQKAHPEVTRWKKI